ncbi:MAG: DUF2478 domain-containing protein [Deltaproteobacteria bacterium]|nr:DUF2478 domain-containing protein [Kofleriaceae bacterium]
MSRTSPSPSWALLLTPPGQRKSDEVFAIASALTAAGRRVAGFAQLRAPEGGCIYELHCLGRAEPAVSIGRRGRTPGPGEELFCNCVFRPDAFVTARGWLERDLPGCDVAIIDELSKLETTGGGHVAAVPLVLARAPLTLLSIRADLLATFMERFELPEPMAMLSRGDPPQRFVAALIDHLRASATDLGARSISP